jgi:hypothetical protein
VAAQLAASQEGFGPMELVRLYSYIQNTGRLYKDLGVRVQLIMRAIFIFLRPLISTGSFLTFNNYRVLLEQHILTWLIFFREIITLPLLTPLTYEWDRWVSKVNALVGEAFDLRQGK